MIKNFFKTAWRNLAKGKSFSLINVLGLAVGIACTALIFRWVEYNVTFNHSISNLETLYEVKNNQTYGEDMYTFSATPFRVKDALTADFSGVNSVSRYNDANTTISLGDKNLVQSGAYVDPDFLKMFDIHIIEGQRESALDGTTQIVISEKLAETYFGGINVIGKTLEVDKQPYQISAVYKNISENRSFSDKDFFVPFQVFYNQYKQWDSWGNNSCQTWVQLNSNQDFTAVNTQLQNLIKKNNPGNTNVLFLYPLERQMLYGRFENGKENPTKGTIEYVKMFSSIALIILLIACINFMNLSTARSEKRAKEIGMHKVLGSTRKGLIGRLLFESLIVSYVAVALAVMIIVLALPAFNNLIGLNLKLNLFHPVHLLFLITVGTICGLCAGSYPAFYLSSFKPIRALKNQVAKTAGNVSLVRKGLVIVQFSVSVGIIIAVIVIYQQIQFTKNRDLGFNKDNVLYTALTPELRQGFPSLKQRALEINGVRDVSLGSHSPLAMYNNGGGFNWKGKIATEDVLVTYLNADADYLNTFGIKLKEGREFSENPQTDSLNVIINESFAKLMGDAGVVGGKIWWNENQDQAVTIKGITENFIYNNMNATSPAPLIMFNNSDYANMVFIKIASNANLEQAISKLQGVFSSVDVSQPFDYHFVDKDFESKFKYQKFIGSLASIFGCLSIFISCLGLFGLVSFVVEQRRKEIGVRKVLGASVGNLWQLLSKEFTILVVISSLIAIPLAWYYIQNWLQQYEYRTNISIWIYIIAGLGALLLTLITISFQTIKAAISNPVKSLKTE